MWGRVRKTDTKGQRCWSLLVFLFLVQFTHFSEGATTRKLRRFKICNGERCKSIKSSNPPTFLQDMDSFLYSRWTRWTPCSHHCSTKRHRSCKFPLICGSTMVQEEAFCYRRRSHCEYIYENNKRDYLSDDAEEYFEDTDYDFHSIEKVLQYPSSYFTPSKYGPSEFADVDATNALRISERGNGHRNSEGRNKPATTDWSSYNHNYPDARGRTNVSTTTASYAPFGEESSVNRYNYQQDIVTHPTCGVARITDANRNGIAMRILGGQESLQGRWPWQVAVLNKMNEVFCGGTLIAPRWILTAAHCIRKRLQVTIGEHHLHRDEGTERHYKIEAAFIHPDFNHETVDNDIALLLLPEPVPTEAGLACLPRENQAFPPVGSLCTILGWGKEGHAHVFGTTVLHEGKVPLVGTGECRYTYGHHEITHNMFCAGYRGGTVDSCAGDSGGPLLCSVDNRWVAFGVTSFGDGCGRKGKYGIYAKVPNYTGWIQKVMKANEYT